MPATQRSRSTIINKQPRQRTNIHSRTRDIVELAPPWEVLPLDPVLEDEANCNPRRVVDTRRRRDICDSVERDRRADVRVPAIRVFSLPVPERYWEEHANDHGVHLRVVDRALAELATWPKQTPKQAAVSDHPT